MTKTFPTRDDHRREQNLRDLKFSNIPEDLITEYLDLHDKQGLLEQEHFWKVDDLKKDFQTKKKLIHLDLENNQKKMAEMSGLDGFDLVKRLPPKRVIEPLF